MTLTELASTDESAKVFDRFQQAASTFIDTFNIRDTANREFICSCYGWMGAMELVHNHLKELTVEAE